MLGLRTTIYKVGDLNKAKFWYAQAFGVQPYFDEPYYVGFNIQGYELGLQSEESVKGDNVFSYWGVQNIKEEYDRLIALGASEHERPTNVGGDIMVCSVKDPWQNIIGLIYNPHFKIPD